MTRFQIEVGSLIQVSDEDLGEALDTLLTNAAWLIARKSKGDRRLMGALVETSSERLFTSACYGLDAIQKEAEPHRSIFGGKP